MKPEAPVRISYASADAKWDNWNPRKKDLWSLHPLQKIINRQKFSSTEILGHFLKAEDVSPLDNSRPS